MSLRDHLQAIYDQHDKLTPPLVVETARPEDSPLHAFVFDRAPEEAAEAWYLHRAHELIRRCRIVYKRDEKTGEPVSVRAFHAVPGGGEPFAYAPAEEIARDEVTTAILLREMERDWKSLRARYGHFKEFVEMVRGDLGEEAA